MKVVKFANTKGYLLDTNAKQAILAKIDNLNVYYRNYYFLNEKNMFHINDKEYRVCVNTFGQRYFLYLTKYKGKSHCFFINKKTKDIISVKYRFSKNLYLDTLLDGEVIKNGGFHWWFSISDIYYYKGESILDKYLTTRVGILNSLLEKNYEANNESDPCTLEAKEYFPLAYLNDVYDNYRHTLPYKCSGYYFQHRIEYNKSYVYIFPENRNDNNKTNASNGNTNNMVNKTPKRSPKKITTPKIDTSCPRKFGLKKTELPDIYELLDIKTNEKRGIAGIPNMDTSKYVAGIFEDSEDEEIKVFNCAFHDKLNKWIPQKLI